jgi:hypothetical protein
MEAPVPQNSTGQLAPWLETEARLDELFAAHQHIPAPELTELYRTLVAAPYKELVATGLYDRYLAVLTRFAYMNVYPIRWDAVLWRSFDAPRRPPIIADDDPLWAELGL